MKIGFSKEHGLMFNSKKFDPLNLSVGEHGIESDGVSEYKVDAFGMLSTLASLRKSEAEASEKVEVLSSLVKN